MELPQSTTWPPYEAARLYELKAEEAAGRATFAFEEYAQLKAEFRTREMKSGKTSNAVDFLWKATDVAQKLGSDLVTYREMAQMYAAMATMKYAHHLADPPTVARSGIPAQRGARVG